MIAALPGPARSAKSGAGRAGATIRTATPADEAAVVELAKAFAAYGDYRPTVREWFAHPGIVTQIAEEQGEVRGFVMLGFLVPGDSPAALPPAVVGEVLAIAVREDARRQGLGTLLLGTAIRAAQALAATVGASGLELSVAEGNLAAQRLFLGNGFRVMGAAAGRYPAGQRVRRMRYWYWG
jgi:ribosomal-protein-alanine N-acetyltransferase